MGWLSMPLASMGGHTSPKQYLDAQFTYERAEADEQPAHGYRVLESACPGNRVYYAAVQRYEDDVPGEVTAIICLVRWNPKAADGFVFAYKDMSESMGPCEAACPLRVLERLTSTNDPNALDWRRRCFATLRRRQRDVPDGALIRFAQPISFSDHSQHQLMRVSRQGRRIVLSSSDGRGRYRVSDLLDRKFEIVRERRIAPTIFT
ncbi:hypothetical protein [Novosphingobium sp. HII-3]|uniref:DUF6927 domain-containing protein n=1 Tax=Novosphingobium sp. HII-3 TaxID=2075565 RepID=UPI000CDA2101|nr:hypothetical protein [Novosphingobium sp. HII-3]